MRFTLATTAALAAIVALAGCSSSSSTPSMTGMNHGSSPMNSAPAASDSFNSADVDFATGMIPHHTQAVAMTDTLAKKSGIDPAVSAIATKIKAEQGPEITTMKSWLTEWKVPNSSGMGMDHGMGMMSDADMSALDSATGVAAAKLFLTQMMQHHEGAIAMATTEVSQGKNADAVALAKNIVATQTAEITAFKSLLAAL
ncbi:MAG: DUF305 domain-containing protein [Microbacteriaceae bacterium]|nr:DUF305 domain-containing protein [Microbacteriaceae bacterium]